MLRRGQRLKRQRKSYGTVRNVHNHKIGEKEKKECTKIKRYAQGDESK